MCIRDSLKGAYRKLPPIGKYLLFSVLVTLVDAALSWLLSMRLEVRLPVANTIGVVVGQVIHYALSSGQVFDMEYGGVGADLITQIMVCEEAARLGFPTFCWPNSTLEIEDILAFGNDEQKKLIIDLSLIHI